MLTENHYDLIRNYDKKSVFSSFLPGISGIRGIPIWCFYVNRGQGVASFGTMDKDHSIMEFYPAHQAYQRTGTMGFRTFLKIDGVFFEAFQDDHTEKDMYIGANELMLTEKVPSLGIEVRVRYITMPEEKLGGLVRHLEIINQSGKPLHIETADGMPELIPYGVSLESMKNMAQTAKAWMEVRGHEDGLPRFCVRASMADTAQVTKIKGFHYGAAFSSGKKLPVLVNKEHVFGYDTALKLPRHFLDCGISELLQEKQITQNILPCCFFLHAQLLEPGQSIQMDEVYGMCMEETYLTDLEKKAADNDFFMRKRKKAGDLVRELTDRIGTKTGYPVFDEYCRQSYLDNLLRGGYPIRIGRHVFYVYSRKHGDIERDYNYFMMSPEAYSQGNGNFRDVNQNRRCDVRFAPFIKDKNIRYFYDCIQMDGYNPLGIEKSTYHIRDGSYDHIISGSFTPGELYRRLDNMRLTDRERDALFERMMDASDEENQTRFLEGFWTDHWTYNLDLVESYLSVYPEEEKRLLFEDRSFTYRRSGAGILPRRQRYVKTDQGIRQYRFLKEQADDGGRVTGKNGETIKATLAEKLFLLCTVKTAALDMYGMGIEMEGGKPGWYDALNGLPGLFGSSMAETYELMRNIDFLLAALGRFSCSLEIPVETWELAAGIVNAVKRWADQWIIQGPATDYWNQVNNEKELYWQKLAEGADGTCLTISAEDVRAVLLEYRQVAEAGINKAFQYGDGLAPTYFQYEMTGYEEQGEEIIPTAFELRPVPAFLEGPVRAMKIITKMQERKALYDQVKASGLYDKELKMYKVNASLQDASFELGRAMAFTPGWLENESIWLHMEYKYLLELLKNGLYQEYGEDFYLAGIPFQKEEVYGRSLLENSSFLASSANPDSGIHGKGFVARLSGSTAEFLEMWQIMMFGKQPFSYDGESLEVRFSPVIPHYLIGREQTVTARFLGQTDVTYYLPDQENVYPGSYQIQEFKIRMRDSSELTVTAIKGDLARQLREGLVDEIHVTIRR